MRARLRAPFVSARGSVDAVELRLVTLEDDDGYVGFGEVLGDLDAGLDLARWDLAGRRRGEPVWRLLGAAEAEPVEVNATIATVDAARAAESGSLARSSGFRCVKVKVGLADDAERIAAVREAVGSEVAIRVDANGVWSVQEAIAALGALEPLRIELCEQPAADVDACAEVASASPIPISLDESALGALDQRVCDAVCLKVARCGGLSGLVDSARRARETGYRVYLASMLDGPLGIAAALHAAAVVRPDYACGLATLGLFEGRRDLLPAVGGEIAVPAGAGLGEGLLDWY